MTSFSFHNTIVHGMDEELVNLNMEELEELHRLNKQIIAKLEEENNMYRRQIKDFGPGAELAQGLDIIQRSDGSTNLEEIKKTLHSDILTLERRLNETGKLTGITLSHVENSLSDNNSSNSVSLELRVLGKDIILKCDIDNVLSTESEKETEGGLVSWLEVRIPKDINSVVGDAVTQVAQEAAIHPVMCLIKSYLQCVVERDALIGRFTEGYSDSVTRLMRGQVHGLKISKQEELRQPTFIMEWDLELQDNFRYKTDVTLSVESSEELRTKDSKGVLDSAAEMFIHMKSLLGLEKAIDSLIRMVVSEGEDILSPADLQSTKDG